MEENNFDNISPLPWIQEDYGKDEIGISSVSKQTEIIATLYSDPMDLETRANASYFVYCCNSYPSLIEENKRLRENLTRIIDRIEENELQSNFPSAFERAKAAIEGKEESPLHPLFKDILKPFMP